MKTKPNLDAFLKAGEVAPSAAPPPAARITKTIRLAADLEAALKAAAYASYQQTGKRLSESDIIDVALRKYLNT